MRLLLQFISTFLSEGLPAVIIMMPCYLFFRAAYLSYQTEENPFYRVNVLKEGVGLLLFCYLMMLFTQTFSAGEGVSFLELIPFRVIVTQLADIGRTEDGLRGFVYNVLCNIAVFIPIGLMISVLTDGRFALTIAASLGISLFIESTQLPLSRTTDVDDLILNTAGALIGYGLYRLILLCAGKLHNNKDKNKTQSTSC